MAGLGGHGPLRTSQLIKGVNQKHLKKLNCQRYFTRILSFHFLLQEMPQCHCAMTELLWVSDKTDVLRDTIATSKLYLNYSYTHLSADL